MKRLTKFGSLLILGLSAAALAGCGSGSSSDDGSITFLNFKPEAAKAYSTVTAAYEKETGNAVYVETAASGTYETKLKSMVGTKYSPAIFQINGPVGYNNWKDYCADMTNSSIYKNLSDKTLAVYGSDGTTPYGIPYTVEGYGIIYNKALTDKYFALTNKGQTTVTKMDDVKSFDTLKALADDIQAKKADLGIDGAFASTSLASGEQWRWQTHLFNMDLVGEFGHPSSTPDTLDFTYQANYKNIFDLYLDDSTTALNQQSTKDVNASMAEFATEKCVFVQNGNWGASQILGNTSNKVKSDDIKFLPIYCGDLGTNVKESTQGLCVGTENFLCINKKLSSATQAKAEEFLTWLYTGNGRKYVTAATTTEGGLGFIAPFTTFSDATPVDPLSKEVMTWMNKTGVTSVPWSFTVIPSEATKNTLGTGLLNYVNANKAAATWTSDVVNATKTKWASEAAAAKAA